MGLELEAGDDAEVATAAAQRPEQVGVLVGAGVNRFAVGKNDSAASSESIVRPWWRISQPMPPPSVSPPTPVCEIWPAGTASPCPWVAASSSLSRAPPPTRTVLVSGSTLTELSARRSMHSAPFLTERPETECPPLRIVNFRPLARAARIAAATSSESVA